MAKTEAQIRANKKYRQTTEKEKYTRFLILRTTHAELKKMAEQSNQNMQQVINQALQYYEKNNHDV